MSETKTEQQIVAPLEDDLDDFDDVIDEFNLKAPPPSAVLPSTRPRTNTRVDVAAPSLPGAPKLGATDEVNEDELSSEFARELAKGMESLMKELGSQANVPAGETNEEQERQLKAAWEAMLIEGMNGEGSTSALGTEYKPEAGGVKDFQSTIQETMRKLKEGDASVSTDPEMQSLEALLKDLGMGEDGEGGDENEIASVLEKMMGQLMSKDILYDPLKELHDKFPAYLANPPEAISPEDRERYNKQVHCVGEIIKVFDGPSYSDTNALEVKKIVDLMSEMQSYGSPPESIMGPLPPGLGFGADGMPQLPGDCTII
ncbi:Pex19 protein family-domain-containing protein [Mucidula mucida]|nr:Pex19 protein family-domain-containing protein [Mucidula mucida]